MAHACATPGFRGGPGIGASSIRYRSGRREARRRFPLRGVARLYPGRERVDQGSRAHSARRRPSRLSRQPPGAELDQRSLELDRSGGHRSPAAIPRRAHDDALRRAVGGRLSMHVAQRSQCTARHECVDRTCARVSRLRDRRDDRDAARAHRRGVSEQRRAGHPGQQVVAGTGRGHRPCRPRGGRAARRGTRCWPRVAAGSRSSRARRVPRAWWGASTHFARARPTPACRCVSGKTVLPTIAAGGTPRWRCSRKSPSMAFFASPICSRSVSWTPRERNSAAAYPTTFR